MSSGRVLFVGCGPGAADLLTLRAVRALETADIVVWNPTLLDETTLSQFARADAEILRWPPATQQDIYDTFDRARAENLLVVRLKGGDPSLFGALEAEVSAVRERGVAWEIVPGVSALGAAGAALGVELAARATALLLVDADALAGGEPAPVSVAAYSVSRDPPALQRALLARGLLPSTPCAVAIEVSRRDELLVTCALQDVAETVQDMGLGAMTLVLAGVSSTLGKS